MDEVERRIEQDTLEAMQPHMGAGERAKAPVSRDETERAIEQGVLSDMEKHTGKSAPDERIRSGEHFHSPWSAGHEVMNHLTRGDLTRGTLGQIERDMWARENPMQALAAQEVVPIAASAIASTGLGRGVRAAGELGEALGLPGAGEAGELLTGQSSRVIAGITNPLLRGMARLSAPAIPGAWQGALSTTMYPREGESTGEGLVRGAAEGAIMGPVTSILRAPTTANVAQGTANLAQRYLGAGGELNTAQIPGAPLAARVMARFVRLHRADPQRLAARFVASMGGQGNRVDYNTIQGARTNAQARIDNLAGNLPNFADPQLAQELTDLHNQATAGLQGHRDFRPVTRYLERLRDTAVNRNMTGAMYRNFTGQRSVYQDFAQSRSPVIRTYANAMRDSLENAMERNAPGVAQDLRLARNQRHNTFMLEPLANEETGIPDPNRAWAHIQNRYGGTGAVSAEGTAAGNPVDLGTLIEGGRRFPMQPGAQLSSVFRHGAATGLGILGAGAIAEHEGAPIVEGLASHPWLGLGAAGLGLVNAVRGISQLTPGYRDRMLANALQGGAPFRGSLAIPAVTTWGRETPGTGGQASALPLGSGKDLIVQEANAQGVDPALALAMAHQESGIEHRDASGRIKISPAGAIGLGQLMPDTARALGVDPYDEAQNAHGSVKYMKEMLDKYNDNRTLALAAYNAGPRRVDAYLAGKMMLPRETQNYVRAIQGSLPPSRAITVNPRPGYWSSAQSVNENPNLLTAPSQPSTAQGDNNGPL
jgi:hypothetical protein